MVTVYWQFFVQITVTLTNTIFFQDVYYYYLFKILKMEAVLL
jgi:hypothetical protein